MAEGGSDEIVEKIVCGLCSEKYKQPKLLSCFHSYCVACLETFVEKNARDNKFDCPLCDTTIDIPESGVNQFEWNIYIDSKLKVESLDNHDCDLCGPEVSAVDHCIECEENYCARCSEMHLKQKMSRAHTLIAISDSTTGGTKSIRKKMFCRKHPNDEIRVVCKDCEKMLCLVCKLTDHEKHNSVDISDEALCVKKRLKDGVHKAENSVTILDKMQETLNAAIAESCENRDYTLSEMRDYGNKLKDQIDKRISEIEVSVNDQCDDACSTIASLSDGTEKVKSSLTNLTVHVNQMISVSDISSLVKVAGKVQNQLEGCILKAENHKVKKPSTVWRHFSRHLTLLSLHPELKPSNILVIKSVSKINECSLRDTFVSDKVCSLSVAEAYCAMSCTDSSSLYDASSTGGKSFTRQGVGSFGEYFLLCALKDRVFFSNTASKEIRVQKRSTAKIAVVHKSYMNPHGIAHRFNNGHEELLVCCLTDDSELMSRDQSKGTVKVLPLVDKQTPYDFISETSPAPTRVAVSKQDGLVCLSYPSIGQISVHTKDGLTIHCFDGKSIGTRQPMFRPFGVCFDNENCIIIADRDGGQVLLVNILGQVIQTLVKGNKPTAVGVSLDDKIWVGYEDKNVTVFQMTNRDL